MFSWTDNVILIQPLCALTFSRSSISSRSSSPSSWSSSVLVRFPVSLGWGPRHPQWRPHLAEWLKKGQSQDVRRRGPGPASHRWKKAFFLKILIFFSNKHFQAVEGRPHPASMLPFTPPIGEQYSIFLIYRVSKKTEFCQLSFWRSCFQLGRNTYDICDKSGNAQFGKTHFFWDTLYNACYQISKYKHVHILGEEITSLNVSQSHSKDSWNDSP